MVSPEGTLGGHDVSNENGRLIKQLFEMNTVVIVFRNTCLWKSYSHHGTGKVTFGKRFGKRTHSHRSAIPVDITPDSK